MLMFIRSPYRLKIEEAARQFQREQAERRKATAVQKAALKWFGDEPSPSKLEEPKKPFEYIPGPAEFQRIVREVCDKHGLSFSKILCRHGGVRPSRCREELFYRLNTELRMTLPTIGRRVGGRDHTTILTAIRKHKAKLDLDLMTQEAGAWC